MTKINQSLEQKLIQMPQVQAEKGLWQNAFHEFDVYDHTIDYVNNLKTFTEDIELIVAGYLHDIGKPAVAKPKFKDGKLQEREIGKTYHDFTYHEMAGQEMVLNMPSELFTEYKLNQDRIAKLVGCHYLPMKAIKDMRQAKTYTEFEMRYRELEKTLQETGLGKDNVLLMFLADKLAQGKFASDREELLAVRQSLLGDPNFSPKVVYEMQKKAYGGKE